MQDSFARARTRPKAARPKAARPRARATIGYLVNKLELLINFKAVECRKNSAVANSNAANFTKVHLPFPEVSVH